MTPKNEIKNQGASAWQRLRNRALAEGIDTELLLQRYAAERFLYRLGVSGEVDRFTLKGAALFVVWAGELFRSTRDVDLLGSGASDHPTIERAVRAICGIPCPEDGVVFETETLRIQDILEEKEYGGVRVTMRVQIGSARPQLQVDIGFGDVVTPEPRTEQYPTLLGHPPPVIWTYPRETSVAEKFEAMVRLGLANSRLKDFWDVAVLAAHFDFDGETLRTAIDETFRRRATLIALEVPHALRPAFYQDMRRAGLWETFLKRTRSEVDVPQRFDELGERVRVFLEPVWESLVSGDAFTRVWPKGGGWRAIVLEGEV